MQSEGFTALNAGQSNCSVGEVATPRKHSDNERNDKMNAKMLESLADQLFDARQEYNEWVKHEKASRKDGTTWSKVDHLDYGDARGRYFAVLRVLKTIGILTEVDEVLTDRFFDSYKAERGV